MKNIKIYTLSILIAFVLNVLAVHAQANRKTAALVSQYIESVKANTAKPDISKLLNNPKKHNDVILSAQAYYNDTLLTGAIAAYSLSYKVALKSTAPATRQLTVDHICAAINHSNKSVARWAVNHLYVFNRDDFSASSKQIIGNGLQQGTPELGELIKISGYLNLSEQSAKIETLSGTLKNTGDKWACWLALARMGDAKYTARVSETVRRQGANDDVVYELVPDLVYTRQKEAISVALEILFEDKKKCVSSMPDNARPMQCGYRVMEYLAPVINNFPYQTKTSGDIDTNNYEEALTEVRKWFLEKGDNYEIIDNSY